MYDVDLSELHFPMEDATIHQTVWNMFSEEIHQGNRSTNVQQVEETETEESQEIIATSTTQDC